MIGSLMSRAHRGCEPLCEVRFVSARTNPESEGSANLYSMRRRRTSVPQVVVEFGWHNANLPCNEADDDRMKRSRPLAIVAWLRPASPRIAWCIVGTAVNHDGLASSKWAKNLNALNPGVQHTDAPAASEDSTAAISP